MLRRRGCDDRGGVWRWCECAIHRCDGSTTWLTETGATTGTVVVIASGRLCGDSPQEVVVVRRPSETETIGQQIQRDRYAVIGSVEPGGFEIRIPIGPVVQLRDGTELRPASEPVRSGIPVKAHPAVATGS